MGALVRMKVNVRDRKEYLDGKIILRGSEFVKIERGLKNINGFVSSDLRNDSLSVCLYLWVNGEIGKQKKSTFSCGLEFMLHRDVKTIISDQYIKTRKEIYVFLECVVKMKKNIIMYLSFL